MKIQLRDKSLKQPLAISEDKIRVSLAWLAEFRFVDYDLLGVLLEIPPNNVSRFVKQMIDKGYVRIITNQFTGKKKFLVIMKLGVDFLMAKGVDASKASTRISSIGKNSAIVHDLHLQSLVIKHLPYLEKVVWDRNIDVPEGFNRPDALLHFKNGAKIAYEYERWAKEKKRIHFLYTNHFELIRQGYFNSVVFWFDCSSDKESYTRVFEEGRWPRYYKEKRSGRLIKKTGGLFDFDDSIVAKTSFGFKVNESR